MRKPFGFATGYVLVPMALVTTVMTGPLVGRLLRPVPTAKPGAG